VAAKREATRLRNRRYRQRIRYGLVQRQEQQTGLDWMDDGDVVFPEPEIPWKPGMPRPKPLKVEPLKQTPVETPVETQKSRIDDQGRTWITDWDGTEYTLDGV
jgi:hypothetical protein